jgi:hypothetical protein
MAGGVPWTPEEVAYLREHCETNTAADIAVHLHRSRNSVDCWLRRNKVKRLQENRLWTKAELWELMRLCERYGLEETAQHLGRHRWSVWSKMRQLGLRVRMDVNSLRGASRSTGYSISQLHRARKALGQKWKRERYNHLIIYTIFGRQLTALTDWLRDEKWSKQRDIAA